MGNGRLSQGLAFLVYQPLKGNKGNGGSGCNVRTQDPENFDEEVKSLVTAWRSVSFSYPSLRPPVTERKGNGRMEGRERMKREATKGKKKRDYSFFIPSSCH